MIGYCQYGLNLELALPPSVQDDSRVDEGANQIASPSACSPFNLPVDFITLPLEMLSSTVLSFGHVPCLYVAAAFEFSLEICFYASVV